MSRVIPGGDVYEKSGCSTISRTVATGPRVVTYADSAKTIVFGATGNRYATGAKTPIRRALPAGRPRGRRATRRARQHSPPRREDDPEPEPPPLGAVPSAFCAGVERVFGGAA